MLELSIETGITFMLDTFLVEMYFLMVVSENNGLYNLCEPGFYLCKLNPVNFSKD